MIQSSINKVRQRRDRLHIMAEILEITIDGALKTQVMYKANLSFAQVNAYLVLLLDLNLLEAIEFKGKTVYKTTHKGMRFLQSYKEIGQLSGKEQQRNPGNGNPSIFLVNRGSSVICKKGPL